MKKYVHLKGRLLAISDYLDKSLITADVGCDHGRLAVSLLQSEKSQYVYASDISSPSLNKAKELCSLCGLTDRMTVYEADGLTGIPVQPDTVIIAGMGGELIADIMSVSKEICKKSNHLILQPMRGIAELRIFLHDNGYGISRERLVKEAGRIYQIIDVGFSESVSYRKLPVEYTEVGEYMLKNKDLLIPEYLSRLLKEIQNAIANAGDSIDENHVLYKRKTGIEKALEEYLK